jgi:hypothetical protein
MSVVHAVTVITLAWLPGPMVEGAATWTLNRPLLGPVMTRVSTAVTAGPVTTTRTKSVLALTPLTVAVMACEGGVASLGLAAEKLRFVGETTNCGGVPPPPPPPPPLQEAIKHATNAARHASAIPRIQLIAFFVLPLGNARGV